MFAKEKCFNMAVTKDKPDKENFNQILHLISQKTK